MADAAQSPQCRSEKAQFRRLTRNFFERFFESDLLAPQMDFRGTLSQALGLLASPGLFVPLLLLPLLMMDADAARSWPIKLIFVFFSVLVMGVLTILEWDALMLDHRDRAVLTPLPVRPRTIFGAKFAALAIFVAIFSVDVNAGSILLLPPLETVGPGSGLLSLLRYAVAHAAGTISASVFTFLFIISIQGILINTLRPKWFRRISTGIQVISIAGLLAALFLFPGILEQMPRWRLQGSLFARLFPPMWYVGVCEVLQGTADAEFHRLAHTGLYALATVALSAVLVYAAAYGRFTRASSEVAVSGGGSTARLRPWLRSMCRNLARNIVPNPVERAILRFSMRTMLRNPKHRLIMAAYVGTGLAVVVEEIVAVAIRPGQEWRPAQEVAVLSLPLVISFFLLSGMRFIFNIPAELSANWMFQLTEGRDQGVYLSGVRKCMVLGVVLPLALTVLPVYSAVWGLERAFAHALYCSLMSLLIVEALLWRLDKLPFTCSYVPGKIPVIPLMASYWAGFMIYTQTMTLLERAMLKSRLSTTTCLTVILLAWAALVMFRKRTQLESARLVFLEEPEPVVRTLNIAGYV